MAGITRRTVVMSAAWSLPVIAAAVATPLASASVVTPPVYPISCVRLSNHGHGGDTGNDWWLVTYSDGSTDTLDNGTVMSDPELRKLAKGGKNHG